MTTYADRLGLDKPMDRNDLLDLHELVCEDARDIMRRKNHDYTGDDMSPFANFEATGDMDVVSVEEGFLVRILDKLKRVNTFIKQGELRVENESFVDAVVDLINYLILLTGYITDQDIRAQIERHDALRNDALKFREEEDGTVSIVDKASGDVVRQDIELE
jgi:hypothetical protein